MNRNLAMILGVVIAVILLFLLARSVFASQGYQEKVTICHCESNECHTLHVSQVASVSHLEQHEDDYLGACEEVITPTVTVIPTDEVTPSPEETVVPSPTTEEQSKGDVPSSDGRSDGRSSCPECTQTPKVVVPQGAPATGRGGEGLLPLTNPGK
jgi:hypothetical protein